MNSTDAFEKCFFVDKTMTTAQIEQLWKKDWIGKLICWNGVLQNVSETSFGILVTVDVKIGAKSIYVGGYAEAKRHDALLTLKRKQDVVIEGTIAPESDTPEGAAILITLANVDVRPRVSLGQ